MELGSTHKWGNPVRGTGIRGRSPLPQREERCPGRRCRGQMKATVCRILASSLSSMEQLTLPVELGVLDTETVSIQKIFREDVTGYERPAYPDAFYRRLYTPGNL